MSDARGQLWSDNPYAPKITHHLYVQEKAFLAATQFISPILYGASMAFSPMPMLTLSAWFVLGLPVILFFRCMAALFNPVRRRGTVSNAESYPTPWSCSRSCTAVTGIQFDIHSLCYVDNREFPNVGDMLPPGPLGCHSFVSSDTPTVVDAILFLKGWLTDGLLVSFFLFRAVFTHPGV